MGPAFVFRHTSTIPATLPAQLRAWGAPACVVMVSSLAPSDEILRAYDLVVTAFPHYCRAMRARGLEVRYLPLAFDPRRVGLEVDGSGEDRRFPMGLPEAYEQRNLLATFVGGLGLDRHWRAGQHTIARCAEGVPGFQWYGYRGSDAVPGPLARAHRGQVWGDDYYAILGRSRVTVNRHGEVHAEAARPPTHRPAYWACNLRLFEATGMGACLVTERSQNLEPGGWEEWPVPLFVAHDEVVPYGDPEQCMRLVADLVDRPERAAEIAAAGQRRCLSDHTYVRRAPRLLEYLAEAAT